MVLEYCAVDYSQIIVILIECITICGRLGYGISLELERSSEDQTRSKRVHEHLGANLLSDSKVDQGLAILAGGEVGKWRRASFVTNFR